MKKAIIHISDLHVSTHKDSDGNDLNEINSFFHTKPNSEESISYLDKIINSIKNNYNNTEFYLIVTGDITDQGEITEYDKAKELLNYLVIELRIDKNKILIVPGDHDINRIDCRIAFRNNKNPELKAPDFHQEKFKNYKNFIDEFYGNTDFNPENTICKYLSFENELTLLGLNSNFKVGTQSAMGFIPKIKLKPEIDNLKLNKPIIGIFHHNFKAEYEDKAHGQWEKSNLNSIKRYLQSIDTKAVFYGNEHTPASSLENQLYYSACGSLGDKKAKSRTFKVYRLIQENNGLKLMVDLFTNTNHGNNNNDDVGYFTKETDPDNELQEFVFREETKPKNKESNKKDLPYQSLNEQFIPKKTNYNIDLFNLVKTKKLFHSGHFHWSETSRAHNWIDVTKILNNYQDLVFAKNAIEDLVSREIKENFDIIIGLGIEGNILATDLSIKTEKPYLYLPYSYRYDDHNKFEQEIIFENKGEYNSVLIITDVVNNGKTIRKLIHKRAVDFFKKTTQINVISLFYTGEELSPTPNILNLSKEKIIGDHIEDRIQYHFVTHMKVEPCPYGEDYKSACLIMNNPGLGCIHKFYNDKKYL